MVLAPRLVLAFTVGMPELPEVQTTVEGIRRTVIGRRIVGVWSNYNSPYFKGSETIKDPAYFKRFKREVVGKNILSAERRAKNILINLSDGLTILIHMKMTGHVMYGKYEFSRKKADARDPWQPIEPDALKDPYNRKVRFMLSFDNGKFLALSDVRRFAKVTLLSTDLAHESVHLSTIGPEPLEDSFTFDRFKDRLVKRLNGKVKQVLTDQTILAGIGNIYADESLWRAGIHPLEQVRDIPLKKLQELFGAVKKVLGSGIDLGGDSTSDYRNIDGERGESHEHHRAYQRTGDCCDKRGCGGTIVRIVVGARATHYCDKHQRLLVKHSK